MCQVNGLNLLVDPFFGTLDFGIPLLIQARKKVREKERDGKDPPIESYVENIDAQTAVPTIELA